MQNEKNRLSFELVSEDNFSSVMKTEIEPFLSSKRKQGRFSSFDGKEIYYEYYVTENAKASIVVSHGFTESAEKFREVYFYFLKAGYNVFSVDHRGHGNSFRPKAKPNTVNLKHFTDYVEDLKFYTDSIVIPASGDLPLYLYSHSMGGAVAVRFSQDYPDYFKKVVLSSPMICANTGMSEGLASLIGTITHTIGLGGITVPGKGKFNPGWTYINSNDTSEVRFDYYHKKRIATDVYKTCGPSFNWVNEAMKNTKYIIKPENIAKIKADVILFQPETDKMVLKSYQDEFICKVKRAKTVALKNCRHEIYQSTNDVLEKYYSALFDFLG